MYLEHGAMSRSINIKSSMYLEHGATSRSINIKSSMYLEHGQHVDHALDSGHFLPVVLESLVDGQLGQLLAQHVQVGHILAGPGGGQSTHSSHLVNRTFVFGQLASPNRHEG